MPIDYEEKKRELEAELAGVEGYNATLREQLIASEERWQELTNQIWTLDKMHKHFPEVFETPVVKRVPVAGDRVRLDMWHSGFYTVGAVENDLVIIGTANYKIDNEWIFEDEQPVRGDKGPF